MHQDERQNLWATRLGKNPIFVRGHTLCPELVKLNGKLTQGVPMKVLDTAAFKDYMREEVDNHGGVTDEVKEKIMAKLKVTFYFHFDTKLLEAIKDALCDVCLNLFYYYYYYSSYQKND